MRKKWSKWLLLLIGQIIIWQILFRIKPFVDFWVEHIISFNHQFIHASTQFFSTGVGELFYILLSIILVFLVYKAIQKRKPALILKVLFFLVLIYNSVWGIIYYRENFNLEHKEEIQIDRLKELYVYSLNEAISNRRLFLNDSARVKIDLTVADYLQEFKHNQKLLVKEDWINNKYQLKNPSVIHTRFTSVLDHAGVLGYYNPFVVESNINHTITDLKRGSTIFHELAHQLGYGSESEANFIAYYIGNVSDKPEIKYFTNYKLMFYLLNLIGMQDAAYAKSSFENIPKAILEDRDAEIAYYSQFDGSMNDSFSFMNNQFLKLNNQDGIISYSKYIELVYHYHYKIRKASKN